MAIYRVQQTKSLTKTRKPNHIPNRKPNLIPSQL